MSNEKIYNTLVELTREYGTEKVMEGLVLWSINLNNVTDINYIISQLEKVKKGL